MRKKLYGRVPLIIAIRFLHTIQSRLSLLSAADSFEKLRKSHFEAVVEARKFSRTYEWHDFLFVQIAPFLAIQCGLKQEIYR